MRKGQRVSSSSESEENQRPRSEDMLSIDQSSTHGCSSEVLSSDSDSEAESVMKRSQRFSSSFSFGEDQQLQSKDEEREELSPKTSNGAPELVKAELAKECMQLEKQDTNQPPRQSNSKLAFHVDLDQSAETQSSASSESTNESSSSTLAKHEKEEVKTRGVKSVPAPFRGISHSSPRVPRARQISDSVLASMILDKEMFLRIELVDVGEERDDLRYRAEWKLSERTKELAEGVWLSQSQTNMD
ncbi:hypothetical protein PAMA_011586 [Pampus argenteus]